MRHEHIQLRVVVRLIAWKQRPKRFPRAPNIEPEHTVSIQVRSGVKVAVVLGNNGGKRKALFVAQIPLGIVDEERIAGARALRRTHHVHSCKRLRDVIDDRRLIHVIYSVAPWPPRTRDTNTSSSDGLISLRFSMGLDPRDREDDDLF